MKILSYIRLNCPCKMTRDGFCFLGFQNFSKPPFQTNVLNFQSNIAQSTQKLVRSGVFKLESENQKKNVCVCVCVGGGRGGGEKAVLP